MQQPLTGEKARKTVKLMDGTRRVPELILAVLNHGGGRLS